MKDTAVKVAVRIRPLIPKEIKEGCGECLEVFYGKQVSIRGTQKAFTFDNCFDSKSSQASVYESSVSNLVEELFKGYNVTILAYGQTGSGKTHSMGTSYDPNSEFCDMGIIPRAVKDIFLAIANKTEDIQVKASFIELYKENLFDLLSNGRREEAVVDIREDAQGGININGVTEVPVINLEETVKYLEQGSKNRVTGSTAMNATSSRSHAIFSLYFEIKQDNSDPMTAKFHMVDLAGSERAKKTRATGERFREGVNINKGLLALGNVISALCGDSSAKNHIPYRDSKLTRLLQDSLGGNSFTLMLACVSPADSNLEETLSTLRYADRAKHIKNKPVVNRDPRAAELAAVKKQVQELQMQLLQCTCSVGAAKGYQMAFSSDGVEMSNLRALIDTLNEENSKLNRALQTALDENTNMAEKAILAEMAREQLKRQLEELQVQTGNTVDALNKSLNVSVNPQYIEQLTMVKDLQKRIQELQTDQHKREKAIMDHELSRHSVSTNTSIRQETSEAATGDAEEEESPIKGDFGSAFTLKQAKLNEELHVLNRALAAKEDLMNQMSNSDAQFTHMRSNYEKNQKDLEKQIESLSKERESLQARLRESSVSVASNKIAEQRRKRVQELEGLISGLKKKVLEQTKLLKIREQSEKKVTLLNTEIHAMKATRVKLIRQMKEDSEKFRRWKAQKDREVEKLKVEDRKKQFQIVKMERLHTKQQNVIKRKLEEASSINKRLKEAVALQKACQKKRLASKDVEGINSRVKCWLEGELEVMAVKKQAQKSLEHLMDDRKKLSDELIKIQKQIGRGERTPELLNALSSRKEQIEKELELRTSQISDIQTKMIDEGDDDDSLKKTVDSMQTMIEAKSAVRFLLQAATQHRSAAAFAQSDIEDATTQYEEACKNLQECEDRYEKLNEDHQRELSRQAREHEEKVLFLLRQMPKTDNIDLEANAEADEDLVRRLKVQEEELARVSHVHELLQQANVEKEALEKRFKELEQQLAASREAPKATKPRSSGSKRVSKETSAKETSHEFESESEEESDDERDRELDPDWHKTPLYKRIRQITNRRSQKEETSSSFETTTASSAPEKAVLCRCSKDCSSRVCRCRKSGGFCGVLCKCNTMMCRNKSTKPELPSGEEETLLNSTFEISKNEPLTENAANRSNKRRKINGSKAVSSGSENLSDFFEDSPRPRDDFKIPMEPL